MKDIIAGTVKFTGAIAYDRSLEAYARRTVESWILTNLSLNQNRKIVYVAKFFTVSYTRDSEHFRWAGFEAEIESAAAEFKVRELAKDPIVAMKRALDRLQPVPEPGREDAGGGISLIPSRRSFK